MMKNEGREKRLHLGQFVESEQNIFQQLAIFTYSAVIYNTFSF